MSFENIYLWRQDAFLWIECIHFGEIMQGKKIAFWLDKLNLCI